MLVTYLHPLLLAIYIYMYNGLGDFDIKLSILYFVILIIQIMSIYNYVDYTLVDPKYNILNWKWTKKILYLLILYICYMEIYYFIII